tara:strand:+ start:4660 stop:5109 length:450 start_codon:yes stop_codon:yes gene_type:complete
MVQGELFKIVEQVCEDGLVCIKCDIRQPIENFQQMSYKKTKDAEIKRTCKSCSAGHRKVIEELRQHNTYPDDNYSCPICTKTIDEVNKYGQKLLGTWVLDHCHNTNTFRGYVCKHCNTGLGGFKDDLTTVKNAVKYLEAHKEKINESNN